MRRRYVLVLAACVLGMAACGDDTTTTTSAPDPADATSCADLANKYVEMTSDIIDQIGDRTDAEMESPPAEIETAAEEWVNTSFALVPRIGDLCEEGEFDELLCERKSEIEPTGEAGEHFLSDNFPSCSG
jgi:hypothetical protein